MQILFGYLSWLRKHWRAATIICLDLSWSPYQDPRVCLLPPGPGPPASKLRAIHLSCTDGRPYYRLLDAQRYIFSMASQCPNLTVLDLKGVHVGALPALPQLAHLALDRVPASAALLASLQGLPLLQTLALHWVEGLECCLDLASLTQLHRISVQHICTDIVDESFKAGWDIALPPSCKLAVAIPAEPHQPGTHWLLRHNEQLEGLKLSARALHGPSASGVVLLPELSHLKHVWLSCIGQSDDFYGGVCVPVLLGWLPACLESLSVDAQRLEFVCSRVEVPANLRALRIVAGKASLVDGAGGEPRDTCVPTYCMHAGLSRVQLSLNVGEMALECPDKQVAAGIQELYVKAGSVVLDAHLQAEVAARGQVGNAENPRKEWREWNSMQVQVHVGPGVEVWYGYVPLPPPCTCGACCQCLGIAFGWTGDVSWHQ